MDCSICLSIISREGQINVGWRDLHAIAAKHNVGICRGSHGAINKNASRDVIFRASDDLFFVFDFVADRHRVRIAHARVKDDELRLGDRDCEQEQFRIRGRAWVLNNEVHSQVEIAARM